MLIPQTHDELAIDWKAIALVHWSRSDPPDHALTLNAILPYLRRTLRVESGDGYGGTAFILGATRTEWFHPDMRPSAFVTALLTDDGFAWRITRDTRITDEPAFLDHSNSTTLAAYTHYTNACTPWPAQLAPTMAQHPVSYRQSPTSDRLVGYLIGIERAYYAHPFNLETPLVTGTTLFLVTRNGLYSCPITQHSHIESLLS